MTHQPRVYVPLRALFLVVINSQTDRSGQTVQTLIRLLLESLFRVLTVCYSICMLLKELTFIFYLTKYPKV